jgi:uncharacterized protein
MRIGIISDTHKNRDLHAMALDELLAQGISKIYHLGDNYSDGELEIEYGVELIRVPGIYCPEYTDKIVEKVAFDTVQGVGIVMAHDQKDISEKDVLCNDIILFGHTHKIELKIENGKLYVNPGHLKSDKDKGRLPSYGLLSVDYGKIEASIHEIGGKTVSRLSLKKDTTGLYKV